MERGTARRTEGYKEEMSGRGKRQDGKEGRWNGVNVGIMEGGKVEKGKHGSSRDRSRKGSNDGRMEGRNEGMDGRRTGVKANVDRVLELLGRGLTNREIGQALNISVRTVIRYAKAQSLQDQIRE